MMDARLLMLEKHWVRLEPLADGLWAIGQQADDRLWITIARLSATREGLFRRHMVVQGGFVRDTVYFSITDQDWPAVQPRLLRMLSE